MGLHTGPPRVRRPVSTVTSKNNPGTIRRGIIAGVGPSEDNPTFCSVFFDGKTPPFNGFRLPAGSGPILLYGTETYKNQPFSGPYYSPDPVNIGQGSPVLVDMDSMCVISIQHGSMTPTASKGEVLVSTHTHTGGYDTTGNPMPIPIDTPQLAQNPNPTTAPNATSSLPVSFTYTDVGSVSYDAEFSFTLDTANPTWLRYLPFWVVKSGSSAPDTATAPHGHILPNGTGVYTVNLKNVAAGRAYDIYVAYRDHSGNITPGLLIGTTAANPASIGLPTMPSGIKSSGPTISAFTVTRNVGVGVSHELAFNLTETDFTSVVPDWLAGIEIVTRRNGLSNVSLARSIDPSLSTSGVYTGSIVGFAGTNEDIGVRYVGVDGERSAIHWGVTGKADPNGDFVSVVDGTVTFLRHHASVQATLSSTVGGDGKYLVSGAINDRHINSVKLDTISDGTTYSRVKGTELTSGTVKQLNDGTNVRTAAHVAGAIDTSSRIVGSIWDGVNSRTPASITATVLSAGGIDFSSVLHTNKILDNIGDGSTYARVKGTELASGTVKQLNDGTNVRTAANVANAVDSSGLVKVANATGSLPRANTDGSITGAIDASGNFLNNPFGSGSGVVETSNGELTGFSATGTATHAQHPINQVGVCVNVSVRLRLAATGSDCGAIFGGQSSGYGLKWNGSTNSVDLGYYNSGSFTVLANLGSLTQDTAWHAFGISVTNTNGTAAKVEASFDSLSAAPVMDTHVSLSGAKPTTIFMPSTGFMTDLDIEGDLPLYSEMHSSVHTALDTSGRVIGSIYDGTNSRTPASITATVLSAGGIDFSSVLHTNKNLDNIADGPAFYARVKQSELTGGTVKQLNDGTNIRTAANVANAIDGSGLVKVANATGTLARANTDSSITGTIDASGNLDVTKVQSGKLLPYTNLPTPVTGSLDNSGNSLINMFGSTSGVKVQQSNGALIGFASGGVQTLANYPTGTSLTTKVVITVPNATAQVEVAIGKFSGAAFSIQVDASAGLFTLYKYVGGSPTSVYTAPYVWSSASDMIGIRLSVDFNQKLVEAIVDDAGSVVLLYAPAQPSGGWPSFASTVPVSIKDSTGGSAQIISFFGTLRDTYLSLTVPVQAVVAPTSDINGSYIQPNSVAALQVIANSLTNSCLASNAVQGSGSGATGTNVIKANSIGPTEIAGLTGGGSSVSLDNVPDGTTYARVKLSDLSSGHVVKTGSAGAYTIKGVGDSSTLSLDSEVADGTTYKRVAATSLNGNNLGTIFNSASVYKDSAERYAGFGNGSQVSTTDAYPIAASFPWTFSGCLQSGGNASNIFMTIGNQTNGIGFRWNTSGVVALAVFKGGSGTYTTIATVTRDTNIHWFSIKVTPGATPGSSDAYVIYFDAHTLSGTTGSSAVTWGSTANISAQLSNTTSVLSQVRIGSNGSI